MTHLEQFQQERIKALELEILRVNNELVTIKKTAYNALVSEDIYLKPKSYEETIHEKVKAHVNNPIFNAPITEICFDIEVKDHEVVSFDAK